MQFHNLAPAQCGCPGKALTRCDDFLCHFLLSPFPSWVVAPGLSGISSEAAGVCSPTAPQTGPQTCKREICQSIVTFVLCALGSQAQRMKRNAWWRIRWPQAKAVTHQRLRFVVLLWSVCLTFSRLCMWHLPVSYNFSEDTYGFQSQLRLIKCALPLPEGASLCNKNRRAGSAQVGSARGLTTTLFKKKVIQGNTACICSVSAF